MYLCDLTIRDVGADDQALSEAHGLATRLARNGQVVGEYVVGRVERDLRLSCVLPLPDSLNPRHHSRYVRESLAELERRSGHRVVIKVNADPAGSMPHHLEDPAAAAFLVLRTSYNSVVSPLWDPLSDLHLPLYLVPIAADERERVFFWERSYKRLDGIWFGAPSLEVESYLQMAAASSPLMVQGRRHAAVVEDALSLPTYTWIVRHYGAPERDEERACPSCGAAWRVSADSEQSRAVSFRCEPCRLVSHSAYCTDAEDWARYYPDLAQPEE